MNNLIKYRDLQTNLNLVACFEKKGKSKIVFHINSNLPMYWTLDSESERDAIFELLISRYEALAV